MSISNLSHIMYGTSGKREKKLSFFTSMFGYAPAGMAQSQTKTDTVMCILSRKFFEVLENLLDGFETRVNRNVSLL